MASSNPDALGKGFLTSFCCAFCSLVPSSKSRLCTSVAAWACAMQWSQALCRKRSPGSCTLLVAHRLHTHRLQILHVCARRKLPAARPSASLHNSQLCLSTRALTRLPMIVRTDLRDGEECSSASPSSATVSPMEAASMPRESKEREGLSSRLSTSDGSSLPLPSSTAAKAACACLHIVKTSSADRGSESGNCTIVLSRLDSWSRWPCTSCKRSDRSFLAFRSWAASSAASLARCRSVASFDSAKPARALAPCCPRIKLRSSTTLSSHDLNDPVTEPWPSCLALLLLGGRSVVVAFAIWARSELSFSNRA
mmetsp:Transcript_65298/g.121734  ORF Transcript_65298/g.121734 Transcript_65298/m.121734 type:complete len:310 (-) Transcript_65298:47-976(-)